MGGIKGKGKFTLTLILSLEGRGLNGKEGGKL